MKVILIFNVLLTFSLALARIEPRLGFGSLESLKEKNVVVEPRIAFGSLENLKERSTLIELGLGSFQNSEKKSDVNKDLDDIINTIPRSKIEQIVNKWVANDAECKKDWNYVTSETGHNLVKQVEQTPEFMTVRHKLEGVHVNVVHFANMIHEILKMEPMTRAGTTDNGGLRGALNEIRPTIPMTKIKLLVASKVVFSSQFRGLVGLLTNKEFKQDFKTLMNTPTVVNALKDLQANGIDLQAVYDFVGSLTGFLSEAVNIPLR